MAAPALTDLPDPAFIVAGGNDRIATYSWGDDAEHTVIVVHGFASSTRDNWVSTGWVRDLLAAGFRVIGIDQRGHGASDKPHDPASYSLGSLVTDIEQVLDTYLVDNAFYVGYSLGARVGWEVARDLPDRIDRVVLGRVPDGIPLERLNLDEVRRYVADGTPVTDEATAQYIGLVERVPGNDPAALLALAEQLRKSRTIDIDTHTAPPQPTLFATGTLDPNLDGTRALAAACSRSELFEIPGRHHFNAPGSRAFRDTAIAFLQRGDDAR